VSGDPLVNLIFPLLPYSDIPTEGQAGEIAAAVRSHFRVIPEDLVTHEVRTRSYQGWCQHEFQVTHNDVDPCP